MHNQSNLINLAASKVVNAYVAANQRPLRAEPCTKAYQETNGVWYLRDAGKRAIDTYKRIMICRAYIRRYTYNNPPLIPVERYHHYRRRIALLIYGQDLLEREMRKEQGLF